jgi:hypothetical protein
LETISSNINNEYEAQEYVPMQNNYSNSDDLIKNRNLVVPDLDDNSNLVILDDHSNVFKVATGDTLVDEVNVESCDLLKKKGKNQTVKKIIAKTKRKFYDINDNNVVDDVELKEK